MARGLTTPAPAAPRGRGPFAAATPRRGRRAALWLLALGVAVVHGCVGERVVESLAASRAADAMPPRIEVAYVREMAPIAPPPAARPAPPPAAPAPRPRAKAPKPVPAASAPQEAQAEPVVVAAAAEPEAAAAGVEPAAPEASAREAAASEPTAVALAALADAASAAPAGDAASTVPPGNFDWPASTRVSYVLTGNYRGEVNGRANVEWIRVGRRYQVHLDMLVGPSFAPIITRKMTSDGEITENGLAPRRYDQQTRVMGSDRNPATLHFEPGSVVLANGNRTPSVPGVQDTASQFIQLTYVFGTRPDRLEVGNTVDIPLALPHKVDTWTYDVVGKELLMTPFGEIDTVHLTPRKKGDRPDSLSAEIWFAPQLRYLPVRILIRQGGGENHVDLVIDRRPEMAGS